MTLANGESLMNVISVTVLGLLIVFASLLILMLVLNLMKLFAPSEKNEKETIVTEMSENEIIKPEIKTEETDEDELIAVLTAAIASSLKTSTYNLKIRSYRRVK